MEPIEVTGDAVEVQAPYGSSGQWSTTQAGITFDDPTNPTTFVRGLPESPLPNTVIVTWTSHPVIINITRIE